MNTPIHSYNQSIYCFETTCLYNCTRALYKKYHAKTFLYLYPTNYSFVLFSLKKLFIFTTREVNFTLDKNNLNISIVPPGAMPPEGSGIAVAALCTLFSFLVCPRPGTQLLLPAFYFLSFVFSNSGRHHKLRRAYQAAGLQVPQPTQSCLKWMYRSMICLVEQSLTSQEKKTEDLLL